MAGRPKGSLNKTTEEVKTIAQKHGPDAIKTLARLSRDADSDQAKIAACRELLDRAYGKPSQHMTGAFQAVLNVITGVPRVGDH
jgi:hypothetical protein